MKILIDADACPVTKIVISIAKQNNIDVLIITDTAHMIFDDYAETIIVDKGADSVDFALINHAKQGDIIVTQDYGVATMALSKKAYCINQNGLIYDNDNIDELLLKRHISKQIRKSGGRTSGPKKRTKDNDDKFRKKFTYLLNEALTLETSAE